MKGLSEFWFLPWEFTSKKVGGKPLDMCDMVFVYVAAFAICCIGIEDDGSCEACAI